MLEIIQLPWLIATASATIAWLALVATIAWTTRPGAIPANAADSTLGVEPPAVVHLLTNRWRIEPEAAEATLVDLAARGFITIEQAGGQAYEALCRINNSGTADFAELTDYEQQVFFRVSNNAVGGVVPITALSEGNQFTAKIWFREFQQKVIADARRRKFSQPRISWSLQIGLLMLAVIPALLSGIGWSRRINSPLGLLGGVLLFLTLSRVVFLIKGEHGTAAGRQAAARWLGVREYLAAHPSLASSPPASVTLWGRYLAYAAATSVGRETLRILELGSSDDKWAWSAQGGRWRKVRIRYPRRPSWGRTWWVGFGYGLGWIFGSLVVCWLPASLIAPTLNELAIGLRLAGFLTICWGLFSVGRAVIDLASPKTVEGVVLRVRSRKRLNFRGKNYLPRERTYLAVDDGSSDVITAVVISQEARYEVNENEIARVTYGRCYGFAPKVHILRRAWQWRGAAVKANPTTTGL